METDSFDGVNSINESSFEDVEDFFANEKLRIRGKSLMESPSSSSASSNENDNEEAVDVSDDPSFIPETDEEDEKDASVGDTSGPLVINSSTIGESEEEGFETAPQSLEDDGRGNGQDDTAIIGESMLMDGSNLQFEFQQGPNELEALVANLSIQNKESLSPSSNILKKDFEAGEDKSSMSITESSLLLPPQSDEPLAMSLSQTRFEFEDESAPLTAPLPEREETSVSKSSCIEGQADMSCDSPAQAHFSESLVIEDPSPRHLFSARDIISKPSSQPLVCEIEKMKKMEERRLHSHVMASTPIVHRKKNIPKPELDLTSIDFEGDHSNLNETNSSVDSLESLGAVGGTKKKHVPSVQDITELVDSMSLAKPRRKHRRNVIESDSEEDEVKTPPFPSRGQELKLDSNSDDDNEEDISPLPMHLQGRVNVEGRARERDEPRRAILLPFDQLPPPSSSGQNAKFVKSHFDPCIRNQVEKTMMKLKNITASTPLAPTPEEFVPPKGLSRSVTLHPHQITGAHWMEWREKLFPYGGILADEMGLGKTLQVITLILSTRKENFEQKGSKWLSAENRELKNSKTTLIICPAGVLKQWEEEIKSKAPRLSYYSFHGPKRTTSHRELMRYDVVLSTYNTVASELGEKTGPESPLLKFSFERIVLDEGHAIRNRATDSAKAVFKIKSRFKWVVTGTPVHNKPEDMFSLSTFLHLKPFDDVGVWKHWIQFDIKKMSSDEYNRLQAITAGIILRRLKSEIHMDGVTRIPSKTVIDIRVKGGESERKIYEHLNIFCRAKFKEFEEEKKKEELQRKADQFMAGPRALRPPGALTFTAMFALIMRLKQAAVLPYLIHTMLDDEEDVDEEVSFDEELHLVNLKNPTFSSDFKSAKLLKVYEDVDEIRNRCAAEGRRMDKIIIVSTWTKLLKIVFDHLSEKKYRICTITGESNFDERHETTKTFNDPNSTKQIMLLSLKAGGVGLNLTGANYMFFLDVDWNPQTELQAQDRIHRFGQTKECIIHRYIHQDTIEDYILEIQKKKLELANGVLNAGSKKGTSGLSLEDMRIMFGLL